MTSTGDPYTDRQLSELRAAEDDRIRRILAAKLRPLEERIAALERRLAGFREVER